MLYAHTPSRAKAFIRSSKQQHTLSIHCVYVCCLLIDDLRVCLALVCVLQFFKLFTGVLLCEVTIPSPQSIAVSCSARCSNISKLMLIVVVVVDVNVVCTVLVCVLLLPPLHVACTHGRCIGWPIRDRRRQSSQHHQRYSININNTDTKRSNSCHLLLCCVVMCSFGRYFESAVLADADAVRERCVHA